MHFQKFSSSPPARAGGPIVLWTGGKHPSLDCSAGPLQPASFRWTWTLLAGAPAVRAGGGAKGAGGASPWTRGGRETGRSTSDRFPRTQGTSGPTLPQTPPSSDRYAFNSRLSSAFLCSNPDLCALLLVDSRWGASVRSAGRIGRRTWWPRCTRASTSSSNAASRLCPSPAPPTAPSSWYCGLTSWFPENYFVFTVWKLN